MDIKIDYELLVFNCVKKKKISKVRLSTEICS